MSKATTTKKPGRRFRFFGDTIGELRKVVWPTRQEAIRLSIIVIILTIVLGIILGALDYGFSRLAKDLFLR